MNFNTPMLKSLGLLPCDYHRYYFLEQEMLTDMLEQFQRGEIRAQQVKAVEQSLIEVYADESQVTKPKALEERGGAFYSEVACELVNAIENNTWFTINRLNISIYPTTVNGLITRLRKCYFLILPYSIILVLRFTWSLQLWTGYTVLP